MPVTMFAPVFRGFCTFMSSETLIREVDEELRRDRLRKLWRQLGPWIIAGAVAVVLAVAGYEVWTWWQKSQAAKASDEFYAATQLTSGKDFDAAKAALDKIVAEGSGGYAMLAKFREAALLSQQGKTDEAVAAYDSLSGSLNNSNLRALALVLAGYALADKGDVAAVQQRVGTLISADEPLRNSAREALGLAQYKAGKLDDAMDTFKAIVADKSAEQNLAGRVQIYIGELTAEGAKGTAPAASSEPVTGPSEASAPAGSEPAASALAAPMETPATVGPGSETASAPSSAASSSP